MAVTEWRPSRLFVRRLAIALAILTIGAPLLVGLAAWIIAGRTVPPLNGERRVPGLRAPVEVLFDSWGVPHVYARDSDDAWLVAGYLQARERLWKMELYRRAASGRLSEIFGERTLPTDRRFLALGLRTAAAVEWAQSTPPVRASLERHAAGVNAVIQQLTKYTKPVEFQLLGIDPAPWTPIDSLSISKLMAWRLAENRHGELVRGALARRLGSQEAARLLGPPTSWAPTVLEIGELGTTASPAAPVTTPAPSAPAPAQPVAPKTTALLFDPSTLRPFDSRGMPDGLEWLDETARPGGSNSWVVAGTRTATGRPLLANDPHLGIEMPSIWYEMHLVATDLDVAGATIPGAPFVIIGHNATIAWGLTNTGADVQDFYVEDVDFTSRRYLYNNQWLPLEVQIVNIGVRGRDKPEVYRIFKTRHGPLIATEREWEEPPVFSAADGHPTDRPLALRWDALTVGESAGAFLGINRAANWDDFLDAVRRFGAPSQNFVYADTVGNIGYAMSGALPIRAQGDGSMPAPGWTGTYEWIGRVPPERLPARLNPPSGEFVTANGEVDRGWPDMTHDWAAPFRTRRIVDLLGTRAGLDTAAFEQMQADVRGEGAAMIMRALAHAAKSQAGQKADADGQAALQMLQKWDCRFDGRPVVSLYHAFERALWQRTFGDELEGALFQQLFEYGLDERYTGIYAILDDPASPWWDDIATVDVHETRDDIMVLAASDAMLNLRLQFGDRSNWNWDRLHAAEFAHSLSGGGALLAMVFNRGPVPLAGSTTSVSKTAVNARKPYGVTDISSYRQIIEPGAWDRTLAINTTGQSGHVRSPHYFDQNAMWAAGRYRSFPFSRVAVDRGSVGRLLLTP